MSIALRVVGPNFSVLYPIEPPGAEIIVGRDPICHIVLPDPKRNVSRRHLAVWTQSNRQFFRVISTVAGVTTSVRKYGPGESGELQMGHFLKFSDYTINAEAVAAPSASSSPALQKNGVASGIGIGSGVTPDPWAELDSQWAGGGPQTLGEFASSALEPDPFGEWGLDSPLPVEGSVSATPALSNADASALDSLLRGIGADSAKLSNLPSSELETLGRRIRTAIQGILTLAASMEATQSKLGLKHSGPSNPLIGNESPSAKLAFLLGTEAVPAGKLNPEDALGDLIARLHSHEAAMMAASRATALGVLTDLDPAAIKTHFDKSGPHLPMLGNGRLWDFFSKHYENMGSNLPRWLADAMTRHFAPYYSREYDKNRKQ